MTTQPIIVIGQLNPDSTEIVRAINVLIDHKLWRWAELLIDGRCEHFDMTRLPEKGDALDHIKVGVELVIGFHLYFGTPQEDFGVNVPYFYNRNNRDLLRKVLAIGAKALLFGDQPNGGWAKYRLYL